MVPRGIRLLGRVALFGFTLAMLILLTLALSSFWHRTFHSPQLSSKDTLLFLGHSHVENAVIDSPYPNDQFKNLAASGEDYFYTYLKCKALTMDSTSIKQVFISISNERFDPSRDTIMFNQNNVEARFWKLLPYATHSEWRLLMENAWVPLLKSSVFFLKNQFSMAFRPRNTILDKFDWGGFRPNYSDGLDSMMRANQGKSFSKEIKWESSISFMYLKKTIELLQSKQIEVALLRVPMHPAYPPLQNEMKFQELMATHFPEIPFYDFQDTKMLNHHFADQRHLNISGAIWFMDNFLARIHQLK